MKLNKTLIAMSLLLAGISGASFADEVTSPETPPAETSNYEGAPTTGTISVTGSLVNAACALKGGDTVEVNFDEVTVSSLKGGKTVSKTKNIELDCDTMVAKHAKVVYTANAQNAHDASLAAVTGRAEGIGVGLKDSANQDVVWGEASSKVNLSNGKSVIPFTAYLKADNPNSEVVPGDFTALINFRIDYQ